MDIKIVSVFGGSVELIEYCTFRNIKECVNDTLQQNLKMVLDRSKDDPDGYIENYLSEFDEFYNAGWVINDMLGAVDHGEDQRLLILGEENEWYNKVESFKAWTDKEFVDWCNVVNMFDSVFASKINCSLSDCMVQPDTS